MSHKTQQPWSQWVLKETIGEQRLPGEGKPGFLLGVFLLSRDNKETLVLSIDPHYGNLPYASRDLLVRAPLKDPRIRSLEA